MRFHKNRYAWLLIFTLTFLANPAIAQKFNEQIDAYTLKYPHERLYIHNDKSIYNAGETVWFKAYLRDGIDAADLSKNLYVDFSDEHGKVLSHSLFPIGESSARGQFDIPKDFTGTVLQIKAYTKWMLNFDTAFLYTKLLKVIPKGNTNIFAPPQKAIVRVSVFPEGGNLINGLENKVAFLATDQFGKPVEIRGKVTDNKGEKIADIKSEYNGMGVFTLKPKADVTYNVAWQALEANEGSVPLPTTLKEGTTLSVLPEKNGLTYTLQCTAGADETAKKVTLIGMMYNRLVYMSNINLTEKNELKGTLPYADLPTGVLQLTVVDANKMPVAERIVFVKSADDYAFKGEVGLTKIGLGKRQENELTVYVPDDGLANVSVSVTDAGLNFDKSENIYSGLLLSSQLKGRIYNPAYYFSENNESVNRHLDLLMLTQGWRRYDWKAIASGNEPDIKYAADTAYLTFQGKVYATPQQIASGGDIVTILKPKNDTSQGGNFVPMAINKDGTFGDPNIAFMDSLTVYYSFANKNSPLRYSEVRFLENKLIAPTEIKMKKEDVLATKSVDTSGFGRNKYFSTLQFSELEQGQLKDVVVQANKRTEVQKLDDRYASGLFKGDAYQFDLVNDPFATATQNIFQFLQSRVPGLQINNAMSAQPSLSWRGAAPALFLDEMPIDAQFISNVNVNDVAYIKVFRPPFFGASGGGAGGGIAVYTKKGGDVGAGQSSGKSTLPSKTIEGYTLIKEFYDPGYSLLNDNTDLRSTVYWNPLILLDKNNKTQKFTFYNNDVTSAFRIVLEGVNNEGKLIHIEKTVQ